MAASSKGKPTPEWVIDLYGIKEALTTRSNAKARVIDAIQTGRMLVMRSVQAELQAAFPDLWNDFVAIKPKKYVDTSVKAYAVAAQLQETNGSSPLGGMPDFAHFEAVAVSRTISCKLISSGKALSHCKNIANKCGVPNGDIAGISAV